MDLPLIALRFVRLADGGHLDLATGGRVVLRVGQVSPAERLAFDASGSALMHVWHPGLAGYLDYGPLGTDRWFEASALDGDSKEPIAPVSNTMLADAAALLPLMDAPGATLSRVRVCSRLVAGVLTGPDEAMDVPDGLRGDMRWPGLRLIDRPLCHRLLERLDDRRSPGVTVWKVAAPPGLGWGTCWRQLAREIRQAGHIPLAAPLLERVARFGASRARPWLVHLGEATVVTAIDSDGSTDVSALLLALGGRVGQTILIYVARGGDDAGALDRLEPLTPDQLEAAVICGQPSLPRRRLRTLAIRAGGRPGAFAAALLTAVSRGRSPSQVHDGMASLPLPSLSRAVSDPSVFARAQRLASDGRPGAARLLLRRRGSALLRRGDDRAGLRVWAHLAVSCAASGRHDEAERTWNAAWRCAVERGEPGPVLEAAPDLAAAWIADLSPARAEALLRSVLAACVAPAAVAHPARSLLGEALSWQGRWRDALSALDDVAGCHAASFRARAYLALGELARALPEAVAATEAAAHEGEDAARLLAAITRLRVDVAARDASHRAFTMTSLDRLPLGSQTLERERVLTLAEAHVAAGERIPPARVPALRGYARARGPRLARARARLALSLDSQHPRAAIEADVQRVALATGARALMHDAGAFPWPWPASPEAQRSPMVHDIVAILEVCQHDADPAEALQRLCTLLSERTVAAGTIVLTSIHGSLVTLGRAGRPPDVSFAERAQTLRSTVGPEPLPDGTAGAWAIRHGDDVTGVLAARWTERPPTDEAAALMRAAAAAMATVVGLARMARLSAVAAAQCKADADLIGSSGAMARVRAAIDRAAPSPFPVLIEGESGAGKELVARGIHTRSDRRARRFAALNCAALADDLIEAELFGHARGAFTGAIAERAGLFEEADGGTLFLDEVGELSPRAQAKLLRAIQEGEIRRVGETRPRKVDARIVAATNRSLEAEAAAGRFRTDLRFRLDVIRIDVPPLRGRPEDIAELAAHFWQQAAARVGSRASLGREALAALARYEWPGNVRELQNAMAAMAVSAPRRGTLGISALPAGIGRVDNDGLTLDEARRRFDAGFVRGALARAGGSRSRAATELGLSRQGLAKLMERLGIAVPGDTTIGA
jgi:DNA-binding NtrC family response regulator